MSCRDRFQHRYTRPVWAGTGLMTGIPDTVTVSQKMPRPVWNQTGSSNGVWSVWRPVWKQTGYSNGVQDVSRPVWSQTGYRNGVQSVVRPVWSQTGSSNGCKTEHETGMVSNRCPKTGMPVLVQKRDKIILRHGTRPQVENATLWKSFWHFNEWSYELRCIWDKTFTYN